MPGIRSSQVDSEKQEQDEELPTLFDKYSPRRDSASPASANLLGKGKARTSDFEDRLARAREQNKRKKEEFERL